MPVTQKFDPRGLEDALNGIDARGTSPPFLHLVLLDRRWGVRPAARDLGADQDEDTVKGVLRKLAKPKV